VYPPDERVATPVAPKNENPRTATVCFTDQSIFMYMYSLPVTLRTIGFMLSLIATLALYKLPYSTRSSADGDKPALRI